jgi:nucleoside-diphosphate-sugar epimerase
MRVLVTGGTSFVGAPLVRALAADGHQVRILTRDGGPGWRLEAPLTDIDVYPGDVCDARSVARSLYGCDAVVHLAYARPDAGDRAILETATRGIENVLRGCEIHGVRNLMLVSSSRAAVENDIYGLGKRLQEQMVGAWRNDGLLDRAVTARVFNAYGPGMGSYHVIPQMIMRMDALDRELQGPFRFPVKGSGADTRSFLFIDDCTAQLLALFRADNVTAARYDVGRPGHGMTVSDLAVAVGVCFGRDVTPVPTEPWAKPSVQLPRPPSMLAAMPVTSFNDGLARTVAWYRTNMEAARG